ncbi:MAG: ribonuclease P protein component [Mycobacterium leprae]
MKRVYRLKSHLTFQEVYSEGRSVANRAAVLYVLPQRQTSVSRIGFAAGKKLGKAVVRNRVKRRIRAVVHGIWPRVRPGLLLIVVARQSVKDMGFSPLQTAIEDLFKRAGVIQSEGSKP